MPFIVYGSITNYDPRPPPPPPSAYFTSISVTNYPQASDVSGTSTTYGVNYKVYTFTSTTTTYTINYTATGIGSAICYVLAVGGGGGGSAYGGSGGGGGGVVQMPVLLPLGSGSITINIGAGGTGGLRATPYLATSGKNTTVLFNASNSSIGNLIAYGGGYGGAANTTPASPAGNGGSGGGGVGSTPYTAPYAGLSIYNNVLNYGNPGGYYAGSNPWVYGGGGGAGKPGGNGIGGSGIMCGLPGIRNFGLYGTYYWAGGGGGTVNGSAPIYGGIGGGGGGSGLNASPNTGGYGLNPGGTPGTNSSGGDGGANTGGGGGGSWTGTGANGGNGGSGIVVIAFPTSSTTPPSFSPLYMPGGLLWLDATDVSSITQSSNAVSQWSDKSPANNFFIQPTAGNRPYTNTKTVNSLNVIDFSANSGTSYMTDSSFNKQSDYSAFLVGYTISTAATNFMADSGSFAIQGTATNEYLNLVDTGTTTLTSTSAVNTNSLIGVTSDGCGNFIGYYNGTSIGTKNASGIVPTSGMWLGSSKTPSAYLNGYLGEVLFYNNNISTPNRQVIEGYLANRWGLASTLPASHPFISTTPSLSTVFNPVQIGGADGCILWLDSGDTNTIIPAGSTIITWWDKSGKGLQFTQVTAANQPKAGTVTVNGLGLMNFTGTTYLTSSVAFSIPATYTVFVVGYTPNTGASNVLDDASNYILMGQNASRQYLCQGGSGSLSGPTPSGTPSSMCIMGMSASGTVITGYFNGTSIGTSSTATAATSQTIAIGATTAGTSPWGGYIAEILMYNTVLSSTQQQQVEGYLAWKWGIQGSLPGSHNYSTTNATYFPFVMPY